jgi:hypothetical protein
MGALALSILWVNTLLIVAAALKQAAAIAARLRRMGPRAGSGASLLEARVVRGHGRGGAIAEHRIEQVGRAGADGAGEAIVFADRSYGGEILGGVVTADGREIAVEPSVEVEVWLSRAEVLEAAACPSGAAFDEAFALARKARGFARTIEARVGAGARVWLLGAVERDASGASRMAPALLSSVDPRAACRSRLALLVAFAAGALGALAGCTALALAQPRFGTASTVGAALCLGYFLLIQPLGTAVRDAVRLPSAAIVRGRWARGHVGAASAAPTTSG